MQPPSSPSPVSGQVRPLPHARRNISGNCRRVHLDNARLAIYCPKKRLSVTISLLANWAQHRPLGGGEISAAKRTLLQLYASTTHDRAAERAQAKSTVYTSAVPSARRKPARSKRIRCRASAASNWVRQLLLCRAAICRPRVAQGSSCEALARRRWPG